MIINVCTGLDYRKKGYSAQLFGLLFDDLIKQELPSVLLEVRKTNDPAHQLYKKLGFVDYIVGKKNYILMKKTLINVDKESYINELIKATEADIQKTNMKINEIKKYVESLDKLETFLQKMPEYGSAEEINRNKYELPTDLNVVEYRNLFHLKKRLTELNDLKEKYYSD